MSETTEKSSPVGNAAKMREALTALVGVIDKCDYSSPLWWHDGAKGVKPLKDARSALAEPLRNCDVGTGEQQTLRFHDFCESHRVPFDHSRGTMCAGAKCPAYNDDANCFFKWAQLPYEEGGAK